MKFGWVNFVLMLSSLYCVQAIICDFEVLNGIRLSGTQIGNRPSRVSSANQCRNLCRNDNACVGAMFRGRRCWKFSEVTEQRANGRFTSILCPEDPEIPDIPDIPEEPEGPEPDANSCEMVQLTGKEITGTPLEASFVTSSANLCQAECRARAGGACVAYAFTTSSGSCTLFGSKSSRTDNNGVTSGVCYPYAWSDDCGLTPEQQGFIIGGQEATAGAYPWMVSVQWKAPGNHFCGGSVIHPEWVLTAAHCVNGDSPDDLVVAIGEHDFTDGVDAQHIDVVQIIVHEQYNIPVSLNNDIALLKLASPIVFGDDVEMICAPRQGADYTGQSCLAAGWGNINNQNAEYPDVLYWVTVPVVNQQQCQRQYLPYVVTGNMLCAGDSETVDTCQGDSGGPLWCVDVQENQVSQIGIVSWGVGCAQGYPGVYTRLSEYINWVSSKI